jgi:membrane protein involved in colicin uptake
MRFISVTAGRASAAALVAMLAALPLSAQEPPMPPPQQEVPDSVQAMIAEYREVAEEVQTLQQQALESSTALQTRQEEVREKLEIALNEVDPETNANLERLQALEPEVMAAQQAQDLAKAQELFQEAQALQARIQEAQMVALERPDVQAEIETFQGELAEEMARIDPRAPELLATMRALETRLGLGG